MTGSKVRSVITYNFDDLFEKQLQERGVEHRCIYSDFENYSTDELPIYHVHGFLPETKDDYAGLERSMLIFSEEGYHHIFQDFYNWSNMVQLNSFKENNCLLIGLSLTDPNLRRLLEIASRNLQTPKHFAFMKRIKDDDFFYKEIDGKPTKIIENVTGASKFLVNHHNLNEEIMKELGVSIIWYETYNEIPELLNKIRER